MANTEPEVMCIEKFLMDNPIVLDLARHLNKKVLDATIPTLTLVESNEARIALLYSAMLQIMAGIVQYSSGPEPTKETKELVVGSLCNALKASAKHNGMTG